MFGIGFFHAPRPVQLQTAIGCEPVAHILGLAFKEAVAASGVNHFVEIDVGLVIGIGIRMFLKRAAFIAKCHEFFDIGTRHAPCSQTRTHGFQFSHDFKHFNQIGHGDRGNDGAAPRHGRHQPRPRQRL